MRHAYSAAKVYHGMTVLSRKKLFHAADLTRTMKARSSNMSSRPRDYGSYSPNTAFLKFTSNGG